MRHRGGLDNPQHQPPEPAPVNRFRALSRVAAATLLVTGCAALGRGFRGQTSYPLYVNNRTDFEVVVYAIPSPSASGVRLGNVSSLGSAKLSIPRGALQSNEYL